MKLQASNPDEEVQKLVAQKTVADSVDFLKEIFNIVVLKSDLEKAVATVQEERKKYQEFFKQYESQLRFYHVCCCGLVFVCLYLLLKSLQP